MSTSLRSQSLLRRLSSISTGPQSSRVGKIQTLGTRYSLVLLTESSRSYATVQNQQNARFWSHGTAPTSTAKKTTTTTTTTLNHSLRRHFTSTSASSVPSSPDTNNDTDGGSSSTAEDTAAAATTLPDAPDTTTHYSIFPLTLPSGAPPSGPFLIDPATLRREFLQIQNRIHPDKYPSGPTKVLAERLSARINEAYRTLLDPLLRAQYLLRELHNIDVTAEDGASQHPLDPELLMEVMDVQETVEEVGGWTDVQAAEERIAELKRENDERVVQCVGRLAEAFESGDVETARAESVRLKFWYSVAEGLREWEPGSREVRLVH